MLSVSPATRVFVALAPVDMRKSFNGLYTYAQEVLQQSPTSGHLFVFTNKLRNRLKILFWDGSGLWVCAKRLEKGTFAWPKERTRRRIELCADDLMLVLSGLDPSDFKRRDWYERAL